MEPAKASTIRSMDMAAPVELNRGTILGCQHRAMNTRRDGFAAWYYLFQDAFYRLQVATRESRVVERGPRLFHVRHLAGADQRRSDDRVAQRPGNCHLRQRLTAGFGQLLELPDLLDLDRRDRIRIQR